ncbi:hypothetical protein SYJ56_25425, partial [Algoriphagus sp. D3-2-R+10]|uniref:hypothetical protein n=1 Tax=Algoriphagus aurantiacus TaxID=3103948 RepID=UPI002B3EBDF3
PLTEQGIVRFVACLFHPATLYIQDSTINMVLSDAYNYNQKLFEGFRIYGRRDVIKVGFDALRGRGWFNSIAIHGLNPWLFRGLIPSGSFFLSRTNDCLVYHILISLPYRLAQS